MKKLLIIESPNKIKTLSKYLDNEFNIIATIGHIRDLSSFGMGFDKTTLEPKWVIPSNKKNKNTKSNERSKADIVKEIKTLSKKMDEIYIATDPDREGEAIAWHVFEILDNDEQKKCKRITFNEITKNAILESFKNKREIDINWVHSQFSRRITDRLIGFKLSQLMKNKLKAESAGRVQSVALKFIDEREKEIKDFVSEKWWTINTILSDNSELILKTLGSNDGINLSDKSFSTGINFADYDSAKKVFDNLDNSFELISIEKPVFNEISPKPVYKTSTLQQDAINKLNWTSKKTTSIAQRLYEGIDIEGSQTALISYPRTDSVRLSDSFVANCKEYITKNFGENYLSKNDVNKKAESNQGANVQNAHEGIRPIDVTITPSSLVNKINKDDLALYKLIWNRTVASLMSNAVFKRITVKFTNNNNEFFTSSRECEFDGFRKIYNDDDDEKDNKINFSNLSIGQKINKKSIEIKEHETNPPARYTQASLIAELEKAGVGRPSTYSSMANIAIDRGYATLENKHFVMTDIGKDVINQLNKYFPNFINKNFTKQMEEHLDKIANGHEEWKQWIYDFTPEFDKEIELAYQEMEKKEDEKVGRLCPDCNHELVYKYAKKGFSKFIGCSNYPACKHVESLNKPEVVPYKCPECEHDLLMRKSKKGSNFVGCSNWPKCNYILSDKLYKKLVEQKVDKLPSKKEIEKTK